MESAEAAPVQQSITAKEQGGARLSNSRLGARQLAMNGGQVQGGLEQRWHSPSVLIAGRAGVLVGAEAVIQKAQLCAMLCLN